MKKRSDKRQRLHGVPLGQTFQDTWRYSDGDKSAQDLLAAAAVRYILTDEEPAGDERARIGSGWGGVKCEIDRIREQTDPATDAFANVEGEKERESDIERDGERESEGAGDSPAAPDTPAEHPSILDFERESKMPAHLDRKEVKAAFREVVWAYFRERRLLGNSDVLFDYYESHGWPRNCNWKALARNWAKMEPKQCAEYRNEKTRTDYLLRLNAFYEDPERWARYCAMRGNEQTDAPAPATPSPQAEVQATPVSAPLDPAEAEPEHPTELVERHPEAGILADENGVRLAEETEEPQAVALRPTYDEIPILDGVNLRYKPPGPEDDCSSQFLTENKAIDKAKRELFNWYLDGVSREEARKRLDELFAGFKEHSPVFVARNLLADSCYGRPGDREEIDAARRAARLAAIAIEHKLTATPEKVVSYFLGNHATPENVADALAEAKREAENVFGVSSTDEQREELGIVTKEDNMKRAVDLLPPLRILTDAERVERGLLPSPSSPPTAEPEQPKDLSRVGRDKPRDKSHAVRDKSRVARDRNTPISLNGKAPRRPSGRRPPDGKKRKG